MKGYLMLLGAAFGCWRRGLGGALLGAGIGWAAGSLLSPAKLERAVPTGEEDHYVRYPEEEMVDALQDTDEHAAVEAAELDDLYRQVTGGR